jgi:hypothetical protein
VKKRVCEQASGQNRESSGTKWALLLVGDRFASLRDPHFFWEKGHFEEGFSKNKRLLYAKYI